MRRLAIVLALLLSACLDKAEDTRVDPDAFDAFFLWAGVPASPALDRARTLYILDGEVRAHGPAAFTPLRPQAPRVAHAEIWLTVRLERLDWPDALFRRLAEETARWQRAGANVVGVTLDFDARTRGLAGYAAFLGKVRRHLPASLRLSVTGLMDWSANADPAALAALSGTVDEVIIQTYQGRHSIAGYEDYIGRVSALPMAFRIALVEGGEWKAPPALARSPRFRGYVVFLLPPYPSLATP